MNKPKQVKTSTISELKEYIRLLQAKNKDLIVQIAEEQTKIRLPATMSSEQFNDICAHLEKVRNLFLNIVKAPIQIVQDELSISHVE